MHWKTLTACGPENRSFPSRCEKRMEGWASATQDEGIKTKTEKQIILENTFTF